VLGKEKIFEPERNCNKETNGLGVKGKKKNRRRNEGILSNLEKGQRKGEHSRHEDQTDVCTFQI